MTTPVKISAFLIVRDEAAYIADVLHSCAEFDEVVVVDTGSNDNTLSLAKASGAKVFQHEWLGYAAQKKQAMELTSHEWVMSIDGDEVLAPGTVMAIRKAINSGKAVGYRIRRDDILMGETIAPAKQRALLRVFQKSSAQWDLSRIVHEHVDVPGKHPIIKGATIIHYGLDSIEDHASKLVHYAKLKDVMRSKSGLRQFLRLKLWVSFPLNLFKQLFQQRLILKGTVGYIRAIQQAYYAFLCEALTYERQCLARKTDKQV